MSTRTVPPTSQECESTGLTSPRRQNGSSRLAETRTLKINEIFYSIQGESSYAGIPMVFVRLTACNLRCHWCDTEYAFTEGEAVTIEEIVRRVDLFRCKWVEITGGEPLLQPDVHELMIELLEQNYRVLLETSGAQSISRVPFEVVKIVDVKCPGSGEADRFLMENLKFLAPHDELKFVIGDEADYGFAREWISTQPIPPSVKILFSPVLPAQESAAALEQSREQSRRLAEWVLRDHLPVRLQTQLHKWLWGMNARGV